MEQSNPTLAMAPARRPDERLCLCADEALSLGRFAAWAAAVAHALPRDGMVVNLCEDRCQFAAAYAAALSIGATTLLPSSRNASAVRELQNAHPQAPVIGRRRDELVEIAMDELPPAAAGSRQCPELAFPAERSAAVLHTSGSTGTPTAHAKTWGSLVHGAGLVADWLRPSRGTVMVATVPPQHMFGLEASVMLALQSGCVLTAGQPMFPEDVRAALARVGGPRALVTTPVHMRAFVESSAAFPPVDWVLSSTAPLDADLAARVEARLDAPVFEIYGSTETGAIAMRRTAVEAAWQPLPGFAFERDGERWWVSAPHLPAALALNDRLAPRDDGRFTLGGRAADLIKIAGKRASLGDLNRRLLAVEGVLDGVFYAAGTDRAGTVRRLAAFVVAPETGEREILAALRQSVDPVFLPRPLIRLEALPRNEAGKLPRADLEALAAEYLKS